MCGRSPFSATANSLRLGWTATDATPPRDEAVCPGMTVFLPDSASNSCTVLPAMNSSCPASMTCRLYRCRQLKEKD